MDYAGLKAEIAKPAYAGMTDAQIAAALTTSAAGPSQKASVVAVLNYLRTNNLWLPIKAAASGSTPNMGAVAAVDIFSDGHTDSIDMTIPAAQTLMQDLVTANLLTTSQVTVLTALSQTTTTIAQSYGFDPATHDMEQEILAARRWSA